METEKREILNYLGQVIGELELPADTSEEIWAEKLAKFALPPPPEPDPRDCTFAHDRGGADMAIEGTDWAPLQPMRILWARELGKDISTPVFRLPVDGVYNQDFQARFKSLVNVKRIEVGIFQKVEGEDDDFWFTLKKETVPTGDTEIHLGGMTQFDFHKGEEYYLAVQLTPIDDGQPCSASLSGSDDYTAWGCSFSTELGDKYRD